MFLSDPQPDETVEGRLDERPLTADDPLPFEPVLSAAPPPRDPGPRSDTPAPDPWLSARAPPGCTARPAPPGESEALTGTNARAHWNALGFA